MLAQNFCFPEEGLHIPSSWLTKVNNFSKKEYCLPKFFTAKK